MALAAHEHRNDAATISDDLAHRLFDAEARRILNISGPEFLNAYETGAFGDLADDAFGRQVEYLIMLMPLGQQSS
jgi:hypothetical protein